MTTRLEQAIQKYPEHEEGIRALAARDPSSGKLKYLDWGAKMLASGQALATEIAEVCELHAKFSAGGFRVDTLRAHRRRGQRAQISSDIHSYKPGDLAKLRDALLARKRAQDKKRAKREKLYRLDSAVEADVIYDSDDLIVRHIKNKAASVHYGHGTKWCISMLREGFFEEYEVHNATFFFFERKAAAKKGDNFDKVALLMPRGRQPSEEGTRAFTSSDQQVDMVKLAAFYGLRVFDIFRRIYEVSVAYPGSVMAQIYAGVATREQIEAVFAQLTSEKPGISPHETYALLGAMVCNDAAPLELINQIALQAEGLVTRAWAKEWNGLRRLRRHRYLKDRVRALLIGIAAAAVIHPAVPEEMRAPLIVGLKKHRVNIETIRRVESEGRVDVAFDIAGQPLGARYRRRRFRRPPTVKWLEAQARRLAKASVTTAKRAEKLKAKLAKAEAKKAAKKAAAKKAAAKAKTVKL